MDFFYRMIKNRPTSPRWIIFLLDIGICAFALFFAFLLRFNLHWDTVMKQGILVPLLVVTSLNIMFFGLLRTYEGIIRLSGAEEGFRCISAVFSSSLILLISVLVSDFFGWHFVVPVSVLFIYFFTASFLIFGYRIFIKELYHRSLKMKMTAENVIVFGKAANGALLKNAIESTSGHQYKVIAFVDEDENLWGKSIDKAKIYSWEQVKIVAEKYRAVYLFLAEDDLAIDLKNKIVDYCLSKDIIVKAIPPAQNWVDGHLQTRQIKNLKIEDLLNRPSIQLAKEEVKQYLTGKRIMITGAAGSIGSEIVKQLASIKVEQLILCDNRETGLYELQNDLEYISRKAENIIVRVSNVRHGDLMEYLFITHRPHIVFHAAAFKHVPLMEMHPCESVMNNVLGTRVIADLSVKYGVDRFVLISTDKAVNPTNVMGATKRIAEMYVAELQNSQWQMEYSVGDNINTRNGNIISEKKVGTKFITTRFGNVLGSNGSVIPRFQEQIDKGGPVTVTHPDITRFFMTIPEACSLVLEAGTMGNGGEIFVFDMGEPVKIVDLAHKMIRLAGLIPGRDIQVAFTGLRPGEKLHEELLHNNEEVLPTHHKKIMISKVNNKGMGNVMEDIDNLITLAAQNKKVPVVKQMKLIAREFISNNSIYEELDGDTQDYPQPVLA
jgi:FlaA1/EpsC-like NDP-sugar epimerase